MKPSRLFSDTWVWHGLCCLLALLSCVAILWPQVYLPDAWEQRLISYAGALVLCCVLASFLLLAVASAALLLRLHYRKALGQMLRWGALWAGSVGVFALLAIMANVPPPKASLHAAELTPQKEDPLPTNDILTGPEALFMLIPQELFASSQTGAVSDAPNLLKLEKEHKDLLDLYLHSSPRWALYMDDDTFYSKPGHMVMSPPVSGSSIAGLVHVAFRSLEAGDPMPSGYTLVKPGDPMPERPEGSEQVADLAVDLGLNHYLLLAWRGTSHTETAHRALNAAIAAIDAMVQPLAEEPTAERMQQMLAGKRNLSATEPELLLSQPPSQYGTYQAEIYANPGEPGTVILRIADMKTDMPLRYFSCPAQYSAHADELFRHDIPGSSAPTHASSSIFGKIPGLLPENAPLFVIKQGEMNQFFDAVFEVWFQPASALKPRRLLLRRCYRVQAYEAPDHTSIN